ncbi:MAG: NAD(P)/FAD-dependent oxidoreductase [Candidatus Thorarchaeota archaeon]
MKFVIIGIGGAGISSVEAIREYDQESEIIMISKEDVPPYSACLLCHYILEEEERDVVFWKGKEFFNQMNVIPILGREVRSIQHEDKKVLIDSESVEYDKLLIAAGGYVDLPPIKGLDKNGIFTFKTLNETDKIYNWIKTKKVKKAVVIGAGFIGLDAAEGLKKKEISVTVIETLDRVLPRMLDKEMGNIAKEILEKNDINLVLNNNVTEILGKKQVKGVKLANGKTLDADIVIVATGVKPNLEFLKDSGINTNIGVIVNEFLQTNVPEIYAAGDIVESTNLMTENREPILLWSNALTQGTIAGYNMVGRKIKYEGSAIQTLIKVFGIPIISDGIYEGEELKFFEDNTYKKMYLKNSTINGYMLINTMKNAGIYHSLMINKREISKFKKFILSDKFNVGKIIMESALVT